MTPERLRLPLLAAAVVTSVVVVWRAFIPVPHTGGDNAGYVSLAHALLTTGTYVDAFDPQGLPHTKYPPVFPALLAMLIAMGARTWAALKMTAMVSTVVAVAATWLWAERRLGALPAFGVALLFAVSSAVVYYSHWVLSDPLFLALTVAALYALARADDEWGVVGLVGRGRRPGPRQGSAPESSALASISVSPWLVAGVTATGLAYFTRSAGLPLVVAVLAWLALRRRWRALGVSGLALGLPMFAWWLRGRGAGVAQYSTEFWMVNPYEPAAGTIGILGLVPRALDNLAAYVLRHVPVGIVGQEGPMLAVIGLVLTLLSIAGWAYAWNRRVGPAELFFPLYAGLVLLWPTVWGGDRFALPLYPLMFVYSALALRAVLTRFPASARPAISLAVLLALLLPAGRAWTGAVRQSDECGAVVAQRGVWACYGTRFEAMTAAAAWAGTNLPEGATVLSRKPRIFYVLSGHPSRTFPFDEDPAALVGMSDDLDAQYVLLDQWDGLAVRYVGAAVRGMPGAFCFIRDFGEPAQGGARLLGVLSPSSRITDPGTAGLAVEPCPADYLHPDAGPTSYDSSGRIPLLDRLDS